MKLSNRNHRKRQLGVGLIEVLTALFILAFGALAIVNLQTASAIALGSSADHFRINEMNQVIAEHLKADSIRAAAGDYNTDFTQDQAPTTAPADIAKKINNWKDTIARSIPRGETSIECDENECSIALRWYELSHDATSDQTFNTKIPL